MTVVGSRVSAAGLGRDDEADAAGAQRPTQAILGVVGAVGDDGPGAGVAEQHVGAVEVVGLAGGQVQARRVAERIDGGVDLRAQAAA